jgi:hypothetical protein
MDIKNTLENVIKSLELPEPNKKKLDKCVEKAIEPPKKRGRPKKDKPDEPPKEKKPRGRPKKEPKPDDPPKEKKPRGRPKKEPKPDDLPKPVKKPRGRQPKYPFFNIFLEEEEYKTKSNEEKRKILEDYMSQRSDDAGTEEEIKYVKEKFLDKLPKGTKRGRKPKAVEPPKEPKKKAEPKKEEPKKEEPKKIITPKIKKSKPIKPFTPKTKKSKPIKTIKKVKIEPRLDQEVKIYPDKDLDMSNRYNFADKLFEDNKDLYVPLNEKLIEDIKARMINRKINNRDEIIDFINVVKKYPSYYDYKRIRHFIYELGQYGKTIYGKNYDNLNSEKRGILNTEEDKYKDVDLYELDKMKKAITWKKDGRFIMDKGVRGMKSIGNIVDFAVEFFKKLGLEDTDEYKRIFGSYLNPKEEPKKKEPKKEEPKKQEPKKEEPKKEEPKKQEPKKEEPKKAEPKKAEEPKDDLFDEYGEVKDKYLSKDKINKLMEDEEEEKEKKQNQVDDRVKELYDNDKDAQAERLSQSLDDELSKIENKYEKLIVSQILKDMEKALKIDKGNTFFYETIKTGPYERKQLFKMVDERKMKYNEMNVFRSFSDVFDYDFKYLDDEKIEKFMEKHVPFKKTGKGINTATIREGMGMNEPLSATIAIGAGNVIHFGKPTIVPRRFM